MRGGLVVAMAFAMLLGACAGAQFRLPQLTDADIHSAALTVAGDTSKLGSIQRSPSDTRALVESAARRLVAVASALCERAKTEECRFDIRYVEDDTVNATTDADGTIRIYRGLLKYLETEEEVAAVVGHEMGHQIAGHVAEAQTNAAIGATVGALLSAGLLGGLGCYSGPYYCNSADTQTLMRQSMELGAEIGALSFSKEQEREADLLSAYLLARAGYDLDKAGRLFTVLARMDDKTHASLFDSHPAGPERVAAWEKAKIEVAASPDKLPTRP
jgi:predicted Zn-dependent protease